MSLPARNPYGKASFVYPNILNSHSECAMCQAPRIQQDMVPTLRGSLVGDKQYTGVPGARANTQEGKQAGDERP